MKFVFVTVLVLAGDVEKVVDVEEMKVEVEEKKTAEVEETAANDQGEKEEEVPPVKNEQLLVQVEAGRQEHAVVEPHAHAVAGRQKQSVGEGQQVEEAAVYRGQRKRREVEQMKSKHFFEVPMLEYLGRERSRPAVQQHLVLDLNVIEVL